MSLSSESKKQFRAIGHKLKPVVTVAGKGLSANVVAELNRALDDHELIKVKIALEDRDDRRMIIQSLEQEVRAELVQTIGKIALIFRASNKPKLTTSNIRR